MRYAGVIKNDTAAAPGLSYSFYTQGCNRHCPGCHNPHTWDFDGGKELPNNFFDTLISDIHANGIDRNFCILGGEPFEQQNIFLTTLLMKHVKQHSPNTKIYVWTGYTYDELKNMNNVHIKDCLNLIDVLIDGPYDETKRDVTLLMRGSSNQNIIYLREDSKNEANG